MRRVRRNHEQGGMRTGMKNDTKERDVYTNFGAISGRPHAEAIQNDEREDRKLVTNRGIRPRN